MSLRTEVLTTLDDARLAAVRDLVAAAPGAVDNPPISEQGLLRLAEPGRHLIAERDGTLVGYAQVEDGAEPSVELVAVDAEVALALLGQLPAGYRLWAHGEHSVAAQAARRAGLSPSRTLLQLRMPLTELPPPELPAGVTITPFRPGTDDQAWLAVNARAFASHPEQGGWTEHELRQRLAADWFDPAGFLLAWRDGALLGYHWTKVHADLQPPLGEVYVLGVDPSAQGMRLGGALLTAGLRHLRSLGLAGVLLYVEADNTPAVRLYQKLGFQPFASDLQYQG